MKINLLVTLSLLFLVTSAATAWLRRKDDPTFAKDGDARLAWFYERTPFFDPGYAIHPVGRELR